MVKKILNILRGEQSMKKLNQRGFKTGKNFVQMGRCIIDPSHCWHIEIGDDVILAPNVHILAHDASTKLFLDYTKVKQVKIGNRVFIGAGTIILPGVEIGNNVIIAAGSVVSSNIPDDSVAAGVPAKVISSLEDYLNKQKIMMNQENTFSEEFCLRNKNFNENHRNKLIEAAQKYKTIFVK